MRLNYASSSVRIYNADCAIATAVAAVLACYCEILPLTLTFEDDPDTVKVNQHAKYPGQGHLIPKFGHRQTHTHHTDCST